MYGKGGLGVKKSLVMSNFQLVPYSEPSGHEDSLGPPVPGNLGQKCTQKCLETNTSQVLGNCRSFSTPPRP